MYIFFCFPFQVYSCFKCSETFSEFDKLKSHLKNNHDHQEWPWICGFCDLVLYYDLEFEVHIKQHTEKPPFACPLCSRLFSDNARLREHLARQHLPSEAAGPSDINNDLEVTSAVDSSQVQSKQQAQWKDQQVKALENFNMSVENKRPNTQPTSGGISSQTSGQVVTSTPKDEAAVSRELAALLLNLHDSNGGARSHVSNKGQTDFNKAEDLSLKNVETAIDLTKAKPEITLTPTMPASITKLVKGIYYIPLFTFIYN